VAGIVAERAGAWRLSRRIGRIPKLRAPDAGAHNQNASSRMSSMNATAAKPENEYRLSRAELRRRWDQLADDPLVAAIPFKVELNEKGVIEVSPPTTQHASLQFSVAYELRRQRPEGKTFTECPVETEIGMRMPDVVWASAEFIESHGDEKQFRVAPDLCVEVLSPRNTRAEMAEKRAAYLAAGAKEVWIVGENGVAEIYTTAGRVSASTLGFQLPPLPGV
jgi:Uma2 family endonuclease